MTSVLKYLLDSFKKYVWLCALFVAVVAVGITAYNDSHNFEQATKSSAEQRHNLNELGTTTQRPIPQPDNSYQVIQQPNNQVETPVNVQQNTATNNADPIVTCPFPHSGGIKMAQSKCNAMVDCEIKKDTWLAVWQSDCDALREKERQAIIALDLVSCDVAGTVYEIPRDECTKNQAIVRQGEELAAKLKAIQDQQPTYNAPLVTDYHSQVQSITDDAVARLKEAGTYDTTAYENTLTTQLDNYNKRIWDDLAKLNALQPSPTPIYIECGYGHGC